MCFCLALGAALKGMAVLPEVRDTSCVFESLCGGVSLFSVCFESPKHGPNSVLMQLGPSVVGHPCEANPLHHS